MLVIFVVIGIVPLQGQPVTTAGCLPAMDYDPQLAANPDNLVTFHCAHATPMDLIHAVGFQTRQPLGVVLGAHTQALLHKTHSYDLHHLDARTALRRAIAGTGYSIRAEGGVLVIMAGDLSSRQYSFLNHSFKDFAADERQSMVDLGFQLTMWVGAAVDPKVSYAASILGSMNDERFTLHVPAGSTTEDIANQVVRQGSKGIWVLQVAAAPSADSIDQVVIEPYQHYSNMPPKY